MLFSKTGLDGAFVIDLEQKQDSRGFFARAFCEAEFIANGLSPTVMQTNISHNYKTGTLRGLHYQSSPATEAKYIRCTRGAIFDVIVDLRPDSNSYLHHFGIELNADNRKALYIPEMFAHGYITLSDNTEVYYQVSESYTPNVENGLRYSDPLLDIKWPMKVTTISKKDASWPLINNTEGKIR